MHINTIPPKPHVQTQATSKEPAAGDAAKVSRPQDTEQAALALQQFVCAEKVNAAFDSTVAQEQKEEAIKVTNNIA